MKRRRSGSKGVRCINGKYYLLAGRASSKEMAQAEAQLRRTRGTLIRIVKLSEYDYMIYEFPED